MSSMTSLSEKGRIRFRGRNPANRHGAKCSAGLEPCATKAGPHLDILHIGAYSRRSCVGCLGTAGRSKPDLLQGTLDMLILQVLALRSNQRAPISAFANGLIDE